MGPRGKKMSLDRFNIQKKKPKMRLEPLTNTRNANRPFATADPAHENGGEGGYNAKGGTAINRAGPERASYRGPMRTYENKVKAQKVYLGHMKQKMAH